MEQKTTQLDRIASRLERMMGDVALYIPWHSDRLRQAHREVRQVRGQLVRETVETERHDQETYDYVENN